MAELLASVVSTALTWITLYVMFLVGNQRVKMVAKIYEAIGAAIRWRREVIGMTQATLAEKVGLSRPAVTNIERGGQALFVHHLLDLAHALDVEPASLLPASEKIARAPSAVVVNDEMRALLARLNNTARRS